jgi:hypothetical protein
MARYNNGRFHYYILCIRLLLYFEADGTGTAAKNPVPFKHTYEYRAFLSSLTCARRLLRDVPADAGCLCDTVVVLCAVKKTQ